MRLSKGLPYAVAAIAGVVVPTCSLLAQLGYGVNASGGLFNFNLANPSAAVFNVGNLGFVPEGIDFRPGSNTLYAINVGPTTTQLYTVSITTGAATPIGAGFPSTVAGSYDLAAGTSFGFDVNPTTLQGDGSIRIRLVSNNGQNLRLHSATGLVAAVDTALNPGSPTVDASAYINSNAATIGGTTALYALDFTTDSLLLQNPPNAGTLALVGSFGVGFNALANTSFDILTAAADADVGIGGDTGYAVLRRPDAPLGGPFGQWMIYNVNLGTGSMTSGALVGIAGGNPSADFTGGLAVIIPGPASVTLLALGALVLRRRRAVV